PHLLHEALRSGINLELVAIADGSPAEIHDLAGQAGRRGARVIGVSGNALAAISPVREPSGVVAIAQLQPRRLSEVVRAETDPPRAALVLVLSGVQDAGNVGAIVRAAEGGGATGIVCTDGTADPFGWKALRGGMGSTFRVPIAVRQSLTATLDASRAAGLAVVATVPRHGTPLSRCDLRQPVAVLLGAEGAGLDEVITREADVQLTISMHGPVESLNVATTAALICFEASRQREGS
ncbi:MAG: RNA methyltransferase, partial [Vicinamibacterales bacterium]